MSEVRLKAPSDSGSFSVGGVEHHVKDGYVTVPGHVAAVLTETHGFTHAGQSDRVDKSAARVPSDHIAVPRGVVDDVLRNLGAVVPDAMTDEKKVSILADVATRLNERIAFETRAAEERADNAEKAADERVAAAEARTATEVKAAEERVLATLAAKDPGKETAGKASVKPKTPAPGDA